MTNAATKRKKEKGKKKKRTSFAAENLIFIDKNATEKHLQLQEGCDRTSRSRRCALAARCAHHKDERQLCRCNVDLVASIFASGVQEKEREKEKRKKKSLQNSRLHLQLLNYDSSS